MIEILPCPFCGSDMIDYEVIGVFGNGECALAMFCSNCGVQTQEARCKSEDDLGPAVMIWNTRASKEEG